MGENPPDKTDGGSIPSPLAQGRAYKMLELLSPAGSPEAVVAAVQKGADAIYMGFNAFNAHMGAKNFTDDEFETAVRYCRVRGCKVYLTLNTLISDMELNGAIKLAIHALEVGADAVIVRDLGLLRLLRHTVPDMPLHASALLGIHNLAGVEAMAEMGVSRAAIAKELSLEQIKHITRHSPIEIEVVAHGAMCFSHSGQCYMSAFTDKKSANRGSCTQPCRLRYSLGGRKDDYPLSLKDSCLVAYVNELESAGVKCLKIEGRMKRAEYVAMVTAVYSRAIRDKTPPTETEMVHLETIFSRRGLTDGYLTDQKDSRMFGFQGEPDRDEQRIYNTVRKEYAGAELRRVPVEFFTMIKERQRSQFAVEDSDGNKVVKDGPVPQTARNQVLTEGSIHDLFYKTGGTPYLCTGVSSTLEDGLFLPEGILNNTRRMLLDALSEERKKPPELKLGKLPKTPDNADVLEPLKLIFEVTSVDQLSEKLAELSPDYLYVPLEAIVSEPQAVLPFVKRGTVPVAVMPRLITGAQSTKVRAMLDRAKRMGVEEVLLGNMGHIRMARLAGLGVRGDLSLNICNSDSLQVLFDASFLSATVSFELRLSQMRALRKPLNTEMIVYGRPPIMISDQCIIKNSAEQCNCKQPNAMSDGTGRVFPVMKTFDCRNVVYNAHKLFMADKQAEIEKAGIWGARLMFTSESADECLRVAERFAGKSNYMPNAVTRGLYYRKAE